VSLKFEHYFDASLTVIPAEAGIQNSSNFLDCGSRFLAKAGITPACPE